LQPSFFKNTSKGLPNLKLHGVARLEAMKLLAMYAGLGCEVVQPPIQGGSSQFALQRA
jgi:hypothetical protein